MCLSPVLLQRVVFLPIVSVDYDAKTVTVKTPPSINIAVPQVCGTGQPACTACQGTASAIAECKLHALHMARRGWGPAPVTCVFTALGYNWSVHAVHVSHLLATSHHILSHADMWLASGHPCCTHAFPTWSQVYMLFLLNGKTYGPAQWIQLLDQAQWTK
jgi:hypothetical protein